MELKFKIEPTNNCPIIIAPKSIIVPIIATYFCGKMKVVVYLRTLQGGLTGPEFLAFEKCRHIFAAPL